MASFRIATKHIHVLPGRRGLRIGLALAALVFLAVVLLGWKTARDLRSLPSSLAPDDSDLHRVRIVDRYGTPLSVTYQGQWNMSDHAPLYEVPLLLQRAFVESEDHRFYRHHGVDWAARLHATAQNLLALRAVRGASTITEQVVRMLHPRPRTLWSRWLEGIEAAELERRFSKAQILELYINQVPYAHQRRGVLQAARYYFDRDLDTLSPREMLALVVLVRAPGVLDLRRSNRRVGAGIAKLAARLRDHGYLEEEDYRSLPTGDWNFADPRPPVKAEHFVRRLYEAGLARSSQKGGRLQSTLDGSLQERIQKLLDMRLEDLGRNGMTDGAVLVVDHETDETLAWVNGGGLSTALPGGWIDAVVTPRQPGSTLKPFLYALALQKGWTAATLIDDSPLVEPVRAGLHTFHNYSRNHYGPLRLREALGNSLNVPAVRAVQFTGVGPFLGLLHDLGFASLTRPADYYGNGLALGDGEVTLFELVQAYAALARGGVLRPLLLVRAEDTPERPGRRVLDEGAALLIGHILSDPQARHLEFGEGDLFRLPSQTAVKTGTSSDHRDAWAVGFSHRHVVGVWMGRLNRRPTDGITGSSGPGLVLRSVFAELNRNAEPRPLGMGPRLAPVTICRTSGLKAGPRCPRMEEWFAPEAAPDRACPLQHAASSPRGSSAASLPPEGQDRFRFLQPSAGLQLLMDPHIPDELEAFSFVISKYRPTERVEWIVDGEPTGVSGPNRYDFVWPLRRGKHRVEARIWQRGSVEPVELAPVAFAVK